MILVLSFFVELLEVDAGGGRFSNLGGSLPSSSLLVRGGTSFLFFDGDSKVGSFLIVRFWIFFFFFFFFFFLCLVGVEVDSLSLWLTRK